MVDEPIRRVARLDKHELADMPSAWTNQDRGRFLRLLLRQKGIDPDRLFTVEYYPHRTCWLLTQHAGLTAGTPARPSDAAFYEQTALEFRRTARSAFAVQAARSLHFASHGCQYQLPAKPQEMTPSALADLLGGGGGTPPSVRFTSEGGWQTPPSDN
jgi:hypothetical protein